MIIEAAGSSLPELLEDLSQRLFAALVDPAEVGESIREKVSVEATDVPGLVAEWTSAVFRLIQDQRILPKSCRLEATAKEGGLFLKSDVIGELFDSHRHKTSKFRAFDPPEVEKIGLRYIARLQLK